MPKATPPIVSFNAGEVSPLVDLRADLDKYFSACRTLQNFIPLVEGGAMRMPGTYYVGGVKTHTKKVRLVPFSFSTTQTYILEFGDLYIRFYKDNAQILVDASFADFDPTLGFYVGEYVQIGHYATGADSGGTKKLTVMAPHGTTFAAGTVKLWVGTAGSDTLTVSASGPPLNETISIGLANSTPAKNTALLIRTAIRALGTVNGVSVADWVVTVNDAWDTSPPVAGDAVTSNVTGGPKYYRCIQAVAAASDLESMFPSFETAYWTEVTFGDPVEITTTYTEAELFDLDVRTQSADVLYIYHPSHAPSTLVRYSHINWKFVAQAETVTDNASNISAVTKDTTAKVTTAAANDFKKGDWVKFSSVVGMTELNGNSYKITRRIDSTHFRIDVDSTGFTTYTSGGEAVKIVSFGADKYAACGTFFEQRQAIAGSTDAPTTVELSVSGDYENFTPMVDEADGRIKYTIVSRKVDVIKWMVGLDFLMIGTVGGVHKLGATSTQEALTQDNVMTKKQINEGVKKVIPIEVDDGLLWVTRSGLKLKKFLYSLDADKWISQDMTRIASHITKGSTLALSGILDMQYQTAPVPIVWCIRGDGVLPGMTHEPDEKVFGWFRVVTDGEIESVAVIGKDNAEDEVWISVKRSNLYVSTTYTTGTAAVTGTAVTGSGTAFLANAAAGDFFRNNANGTYVEIASVNSDTSITLVSAYPAIYEGGAYTIARCNSYRRYIEYFKPHDFYSTIANGFFVHCGLSTTLSSATTIPGLTHLAGKTVSVLVAGVDLGDFTVSPAGVVTLGATYSGLCHVGLPYDSYVEPMKLSAGSPLGSARGKKQKINKVRVSLHNTCKGKIGPSTTRLQDIDPDAVAGTLVSDDYDVQFDGDWADEATVVINQSRPYPMTVLGIVPHLTLNEDM